MFNNIYRYFNSLSKKEQLYITILIYFSIFFIFIQFIYIPLNNKIKKTKKALNNEVKNYYMLKDKIKEYIKLRSKLPEDKVDKILQSAFVRFNIKDKVQKYANSNNFISFSLHNIEYKKFLSFLIYLNKQNIHITKLNLFINSQLLDIYMEVKNEEIPDI